MIKLFTNTKRYAPGCVLGCLIMLACGAAHAARLTSVVRGVGAGSDKAAALVGYYVRDFFSKDERFDLVDTSKELGNADRDRALKAFQLAEENMQRGREAYDNLDLDSAVDLLNKALTKYETFAAYVNDFNKVSETLMLLGATNLLRGEEKPGIKRLEQAVCVYPKVEPDPRIFNPAMRTRFQSIVSKLGNRATGSVELTSSPSYAEAYVDGRFVGVTPVLVDNLTEGRHYLRMEKTGFKPWGKVLEVVGRSESNENGVLRNTAHLDDFERAVDGAIKQLFVVGRNSDNPSADPAIVDSRANSFVGQIGQLANAQQAFIAKVTLDGETVEVSAIQYQINPYKRLRQARRTFAYDARAGTYEREIGSMMQEHFGGPQNRLEADVSGAGTASLVVTLPATNASATPATAASSASKAAAASSAARDSDGPCVGSCQVKRVLVITGLTLTVAAAGVGTWQYLEAARDYKNWRATAQPLGHTLRTNGFAEARRGDIIMASAAAVAIATGLIALIWDSSPATEPPASSRGAAATLQAVPVAGGAMMSAMVSF